VTTPQAVAVGDVRREITFCRKANLKIIGIIENMSGFVCPNCKECTNIFSKYVYMKKYKYILCDNLSIFDGLTRGNGEKLAAHSNVPFLGAVPIDPNLALSAEKGSNFMEEFKSSPAAEIFRSLILNIWNKKWHFLAYQTSSFFKLCRKRLKLSLIFLPQLFFWLTLKSSFLFS